MIPEIYLDHITKTATCWLWTGSQTQEGYPGFLKKRVGRVIWTLINGEIPAMHCVQTTCKHKLCVNPEHLFITRNVPKRKSFEQRFFSKVEKTSYCWNWIGSKACVSKRGEPTYGKIHNPDGERLAHRASWELYFGKIPNKLNVLHECDNPRCVNPDHLFLGHQDDNMDDMIKKDRGNTKLNCARVKEIKSKFAAWVGTKPEFCHLVKVQYEVHYETIMGVITKKHWDQPN